MADISVLNTDSDLSAQTLLTAEGSHTVTGSQTFDRDPNPPFVVTSGSAVVTNLDSDKVDGRHEAEFAALADTETIAGVWSFSAKPNINAGLQFPAVQVASADVNTLDDYEEGSWTPTISSTGGGTPTYTTQVGKYIKVGKKVFVTGKVQLATKGTLAAGGISIGGLPFATENTASQESSASFSNYALTTAIVALWGNIAPNTTSISLFLNTAAATSVSTLTDVNLSATSLFSFSATYIASA
jgi:hypothetical protein